MQVEDCEIRVFEGLGKRFCSKIRVFERVGRLGRSEIRVLKGRQRR